MPRHFTATAFIVDSQNRTLLLWHKRLGRWMPPGVHVEENELPEETAKRECKEETGLDVEIFGAHDLHTHSTLSNIAIQQYSNRVPDLFIGNPSEGRMLKTPIAMLLEEIPAYPVRNEPAHQHMDFLFLARPIAEGQTATLNYDEGYEMRWFTREEVKALDEATEIFANVKRYILSVL